MRLQARSDRANTINRTTGIRMNDINSITSTLDLLEAHHNDKDFDEMISRNKFLRECKVKGFDRMKRLGLISNDKKPRQPRRHFTDEQKREFSSRAYKLRKQKTQRLQQEHQVM